MIKLQGTSPAPIMASDDRADGSFEGYICVYATPTSDSRRLIVEPGAFSGVDAASVRMLWQHDETKPIGVWTRLEERNRGLYGYGVVNLEVQAGKEAYALIKQGAIDGISAGWRARKYSIPKNDREGINTIEGDLYEASLVTFPAFEDARVMKCSEGEDISPRVASLIDLAFSHTSCLARSKAGPELEIRKFEAALRDAGLVSKTEAARIVALVKADSRFARMSAARRDDETEAKAVREAEALSQILINNLKG